VNIAVLTKVAGKEHPNGLRVAKALRDLGHGVSCVEPWAATKKKLAGRELVLATGNLISQEHRRPGTFRSVRAAMDSGAVLALWYFDFCNPAMRNAPWKFQVMEKLAGQFDFLAMTDHSYPWERRAKRFLHLLQGVDADEFMSRPEPPEPRDRDVIMTGGYDLGFEDRLAAVEAMRKAGASVEIFGRNSKRKVHGQAFWDEHQKSRVVFVPRPPAEAQRWYWSNRIYLAAVTGTPCLVGYIEGLEKHFTDERDVVFFDGRAEMLSRLAVLLEDPLKRVRIGRGGRWRVLIDHTYKARVEELMAAIFGKEPS